MSALIGKEILIVDDAEDVRKLARKILEGDGAVVREASSVQEALEMLSSYRPHLILLDLNFPAPDGFRFLADRLVADWKDIPTVILSGLRDQNSVVRAVGLGATDYLVKPIKATILLQKARKNLRVSSFQKVVFPDSARPKAQVELPVRILKVHEGGFSLDASAKLAKDEPVRIVSELLARLGAENIVTKVASGGTHYQGEGRYGNEIVFSGVGEAFTKKIKILMKSKP